MLSQPRAGPGQAQDVEACLVQGAPRCAARRDLLKAGMAALAAVGTAAACGHTTAHRRPSVSLEALPVPGLAGETSVAEALRSRRSVRAFTNTPLTRAELGELLWAAQGVTHDQVRRTAPSAGALYPLEVYAVQPAEAWHYIPQGHRVERWPSATVWPNLVAATVSHDAVRAAPAALVIAGVADRTAVKYGGDAVRYVAMEVGHAAQNVLLQAVGLGLGAVPLGALDREAVAAALTMPDGETAHYVIPVGHPAASG